MGLLDSFFGGGGGNAAGIQTDYANQALDLQKQIYADTKEAIKPWYNAGTSAVSALMDRLGLQGGSTKTRDQIIKELTPQYTTTTGQQGGGQFVGPDGRIYEGDNASMINRYVQNNPQDREFAIKVPGFDPKGDITGLGFKSMGPAQTSSVNYDALNKAADEAMAGQGTPSNYGDLLADYQWTADPGYQFQLDQGTKALERKAAASGKTFTPEMMKALSEYTVGTANQNYGEGFARDQTKKNGIYNMLAGVSGMGQVATGQQAGAGTNYANQATDLLTGIGNVQAAGKQADSAARGSMFGTLLKYAPAIAGMF